MTVKDMIPSFPKLMSVQEVVGAVAHGTNDYRQVQAKYYSDAERVYAEELAVTKIYNLIKDGKIRATGRMSETKKGLAARWEAQQYKQHSKLRTYIDVEFWVSAIFAKTTRLNTARIETREYTDIMLVFSDCKEHLAEDVIAHRTEEPCEEESEAESEYSTPYIDLMLQAIDHFAISRENQPIKDNLVEWFLSQTISGQKVSKATAEYMASFVRMPESRAGGNRPWKVRAQQHQKNA